MGWLSGKTGSLKLSPDKKPATTQLGILAFEAAKTMSRVLSLYKSLSDPEISRLRKDIIKSEGVSYLNSNDETFLLTLACAEKMEDLDKAAVTVSMLGKKCSDFGLKRFEVFYADLKLGTVNLGKFEYQSRRTERKINKMEKLLWATSGLYSSLEMLADMEVSERKLNNWKKNCSQVQMKNMNFEGFEQKIAQQRKQVRQLREISLWTQSFDKTLKLMARIVCIVYARICAVFGPHVPGLLSGSGRQREIATHVPQELRLLEPVKEQVHSRSGPIVSNAKTHFVRFYSQRLISFQDGVKHNHNRVFHAAGPSTIGGCGLDIRYANLILMAEEYMDISATIKDDGREEMYKMLPENLKMMVKAKLSKHMRRFQSCGCVDDELLAGGWREGVNGILRWLSPMAHDTLKWQMERNFEKTRFEMRPEVLLLQTLHFADKEKTETAIAEVLVGLSCIYVYENRRSLEG